MSIFEPPERGDDNKGRHERTTPSEERQAWKRVLGQGGCLVPIVMFVLGAVFVSAWGVSGL